MQEFVFHHKFIVLKRESAFLIKKTPTILFLILSIFLLLLICLVLPTDCFSQVGVGINISGNSADTKAILDIDAKGMSPKAGLLIPRMTISERNTIPSPTESLLIYNISTHCFEAYYNGGWVAFGCLSNGCSVQCSGNGNIGTFAGIGTPSFSGDGGDAICAGLNLPRGITIDAAGNMYIADEENNSIRKVSTSGIITTIAGNGIAGFNSDNIAATNAELNYPTGVAIDAAGNIYISDYQNYRVRMINSSGIISTFAGAGIDGYSGDNGPASNAKISGPLGVAVDASGNLYIADYINNRIRKVNASGLITTIAGKGSFGYSGDGGAATNAELYYPYGVAADAYGNVYIADYQNNRIRKVNTSGIISTIAGNGIGGYSGDGGAATNAEIYNPAGVGVDASGNIYIGDYSNYRIRKVNTSGVISTFAGTGTYGFSGDGGIATNAEVNASFGITFDSSGNVYFGDGFNARIRKVCK